MKSFIRNRRSCQVIAAFSSLLFLTGAIANAQSKVSTKPVGFTSVVVDAGKVAALSLPLNYAPDYHGVISSLGSHTVQTSFAGWSVNTYGPFDTLPHVIRMLTGAAQGRQFKIEGNTADTLTLSSSYGNLSAILAVGDEYQIVKAPTLQSLFGATAPSLLTNSDPDLADSVLLRGEFGWLTYYNDGTQWLRQGAGEATQNHVAVPLEAGLLLVRRSSSPFNFLLIGSAPTTDLKSDLLANRATLFGNRFPVERHLSDLKVNTLAGWLASNDPNVADKVLIRGSFGWLTYYYNGSQWLRQGAGPGAQNPAVEVGISVLIARGPGSDVTIDQALPATLSEF
jgi:uncharacterized protein (TIGR02597 family)